MMNQNNNMKYTSDHPKESFFLDGQHSISADDNHDDFTLESDVIDDPLEYEPIQEALLLKLDDPEQPEDNTQIALEGMEKPIHQVTVIKNETAIQAASFQHATNLLDSLESQDIDLQYQCREGYCGSCRVQLLKGQVHYTEEPMAWVNEDEILPCCCIPKTAISIKLP